LPLHPEFRTLPMVWYIPPLSPLRLVDHAAGSVDAVDRLRIPVKYLANLLTAGEEAPVRLALKRLLALRQFMRTVHVEGRGDERILDAVDLSAGSAEEIYSLLALARHGERFVVPTKDGRDADLHTRQGCCGIPDCG
jgi:nitrate reductase beta subunit